MSTTKLPSQASDFPAWYVEVVKRAELAEHGPSKGSMIIKPHGYAIWEHTQRALDDRFKATGHENVYFPLLIPMGLLEKEADHVEGIDGPADLDPGLAQPLPEALGHPAADVLAVAVPVLHERDVVGGEHRQVVGA